MLGYCKHQILELEYLLIISIMAMLHKETHQNLLEAFDHEHWPPDYLFTHLSSELYIKSATFCEEPNDKWLLLPVALGSGRYRNQLSLI